MANWFETKGIAHIERITVLVRYGAVQSFTETLVGRCQILLLNKAAKKCVCKTKTAG